MNVQQLLEELRRVKTDTAEEIHLATLAAQEILALAFRLHAQHLAAPPEKVVFNDERWSVQWQHEDCLWTVFLLYRPAVDRPAIDLKEFADLLDKGGLREFIVAGVAKQNEIVQSVIATRNGFVDDPSINWNWGHSDDDIPTQGKNGTQGVL
ncbi:MAG: hypothetical protein M3M85_03025 [bacterium]|nr:hypothetical protein [bacterium]